MKKLRVGIIGMGMMGIQHAEAVRKLPDALLVSFSSRNEEHLCTIGKSFGVRNLYPDYIQMLEHEDLDAVHVCVPNNLHADICKRALEKGIHVFCEKPLACTAMEAQELSRLAEKSGLIAAVDFNYRYNVMVREMHERLLLNDWGRSFMVRGEYHLLDIAKVFVPNIFLAIKKWH